MKISFSRQFFEKKKHLSNKFHENPSSGSCVAACRHTEGRTDVKLRLVFRDIVISASKSWLNQFNHRFSSYMCKRLLGSKIYVCNEYSGTIRCCSASSEFVRPIGTGTVSLDVVSELISTEFILNTSVVNATSQKASDITQGLAN